MRNWRKARYCSVRAFILQQLLKLNGRFWQDRESIPVAILRERFDKLALRIPRIPMKIEFSTQSLDGLSLNWFRPRNSSYRRVALYLHGGAYMAGSPMTTHRDLIARLTTRTGLDFVAVNYRKAPEHAFPAGLEDANKAYQKLLETYDPDQVIVMGDSAGGGLALALVLQLRDDKIPLPTKVVVMSPLTDLAGTGVSLQRNKATDAMVPGWLIHQVARLYAGQNEIIHPYISPLYGDFSGFPQTLIQVSDSEVLLDDARRVRDKMCAAGVPVQLDIWHNLPHVWQAFAGVLPEGRAAINDIAEFIRS